MAGSTCVATRTPVLQAGQHGGVASKETLEGRGTEGVFLGRCHRRADTRTRVR